MNRHCNKKSIKSIIFGSGKFQSWFVNNWEKNQTFSWTIKITTSNGIAMTWKTHQAREWLMTINRKTLNCWKGTYTQLFALHLWAHISIAIERDTNLMNILHYLLALHKKPREHISPFDKLSRCSLGYVIYFGQKAQIGGWKVNKQR